MGEKQAWGFLLVCIRSLLPAPASWRGVTGSTEHLLRLQLVATAYFHCAHHTIQADLQVGSCLVTVAKMVTDSSSLQAVEETIASQKLERSLRCGRAALNWRVQGRALCFSWNSTFHTAERSELGKELAAFSLAFYLSRQGRGMLKMGAELLFPR